MAQFPGKRTIFRLSDFSTPISKAQRSMLERVVYGEVKKRCSIDIEKITGMLLDMNLKDVIAM